MPETSPTEPIIFAVDAARLSYGDFDSGKGKGDIHGSYSADLICFEGKIRNPFRWQGALWTTVSTSGSGLTGIEQVEAYCLVPLKMFAGTPTTYRDKTGTEGKTEAARNDPNGFYDRMKVTHGKDTYVMQGPPAVFVPEPNRPDAKPAESQLDMFAL